MIEAKELRKVYKTKKGVVVKALDGVSLKLPDTGMVFILGKSGSGKSTLLNVLGGLDSFDSGEIVIKGTSAKDFRQSHYDSYRNTYIGFIFQEYNILEELSIGANVALAIELQGRKPTNEEINGILREVDLEGFGARKPNELSGGQKQRVAIARALVKKPEIIMADEPTGALDSATGRQVFDTLKKLSRDKLVLIVSHDREFSEQYADRIIELKDGVIISDVEKHAPDGAVTEDLIDDGITFGESEIKVKQGYQLTEEDRIAINKYIAALESGAQITVATYKKRFSAQDFRPTDETKIKNDKVGDFKLIKSKLSVKNAFKLGSGALNHKKVRLVITILLSLIAFTLFGISDTVAAYNSIVTTTNSIHDTGVDYAAYRKVIDTNNKYWSKLTPAEIETIANETGNKVVGVYKDSHSLSYKSNIDDSAENYDALSEVYSSSFSGIIGADEGTFEEFGLSLVAGKVPNAKSKENEIVITKYAYEFFEKTGYKEYTDGGAVSSKIEKYDDLIGKSITFDLEYNGSRSYKIVGIVDTGFDTERYQALANPDAEGTMNFIEYTILSSELEAAQDYSFACVGFLGKAMFDEIVNQNIGTLESISSVGSVSFYIIKDGAEIDDVHSIHSGKYSEDIINTFGFSALQSLANTDNIIWLGEELASLRANQIVLPIHYVNDFLSFGGMYDEIFYNPDKLVGQEKEFLNNRDAWGILYSCDNLETIVGSIDYFAAVSYARENPESARSALLNLIAAERGEEAANEITREEKWYGEFAWYFVNGSFSDLVTEEYVGEYAQALASRYGISEMLISDSMRDILVKSFRYNEKEYKSWNYPLFFRRALSYDSIISYHYAATYFEDAISYYRYVNGTDAVVAEGDVENVLSIYANYVESGRKESGFTPAANKTYELYRSELLIQLYKNLDSRNVALYVFNYADTMEELIEDIEIVGFISDSVNNNGERVDFAVINEDLLSRIFGANRGGMYSYAVGAMPQSASGIRDVVKFTKNYTAHDGTVKYILTNNVTNQLDMAEEVLVVLGEVFLYVGIAFAVFASLMLANFISTSVAHKKQEIGILRAIGSRSGDVFRIFFAESFIIAMINYVLSLIGTITVTVLVNTLLRNEAGLLITFLNFGIRQIGLLLLISLGVAFIATFLPVKKIASMKPIDAIKNRK